MLFWFEVLYFNAEAPAQLGQRDNMPSVAWAAAVAIMVLSIEVANGGGPCSLRDSSPLSVVKDGTVVENMRIKSTGKVAAVTVKGASNVVLRNLVIEHSTTCHHVSVSLLCLALCRAPRGNARVC